ncbi:putative molybdopterin biosynthesis protein Mog [Cellulomonas hominis]|uniref:Molybdenum cofactor synthesis domain-containing protein n=1 Tax=Cellulomonas hominis TaxID=156981 RepID=A0A511F9K4_9CELL|nr:molybdenum cofactor synthesis domain-containing protein [Cellulomonas hominis]MBB5472960.1 molybdenum cofactor synthesis domain-containing protein [Cellulomonas hominis]GEL45903.1 putative molybdopterin biosynthesis protein Mog [Cellulomonas hominis]
MPETGGPPAGAPALRARVVTVSTRAAAGVYPDRSGPALAAAVAALGFVVEGPEVVPDGPPVGAALRSAVAAGVALVVTTGGTGLAPGDDTPEQTAPLLDRDLPGVPEAVRAAGVAAGVPSAMLSRGRAGLAGRTVVVNLPGSVRAVEQAMAAVGAALRHAVDQVAGGDH